MDDRLTRLSKTLSHVLRHRPDAVGIDLDPAGWVEVSTLLSAMAQAGYPIAEADLEAIMLASDNQRYELSGSQVRAAQGHSIAIDLELESSIPPELLYHGTVGRYLQSIRDDGLIPGDRAHVHLSADRASATTVGARRGNPVILTIDAGRMHEEGHQFFVAANGVWLVGHVPRRFISGLESRASHSGPDQIDPGGATHTTGCCGRGE